MLLFKKRFHEGLTNGTITVSYRRWQQPMVKVGGRYRCHPIGVILVEGVSRTTVAEIAEGEARRAGFDDHDELLEYLRTGRPDEPLLPETEIYRVELRYAGDEDGRPAAFSDEISADEARILSEKLAKLDARSAGGPWTWQTLALIQENPHRRAGDLADLLKREKLDFKADVRKLKALGLTVSHEVGYSISRRGEAFLKLAAPPAPPTPPAPQKKRRAQGRRS